MVFHLATLSVAVALFLDTASYWRQIKKTIKTKRSSQISTTAFLYKIGKAVCALLGLSIYKNWVGVGMELFMVLVYIVSLYVIARYKPRGWELWK
jgi:membrane protein YdbS with pleckstrin-like domain